MRLELLFKNVQTFSSRGSSGRSFIVPQTWAIIVKGGSLGIIKKSATKRTESSQRFIKCEQLNINGLTQYTHPYLPTPLFTYYLSCMTSRLTCGGE